MTVHFRTRYTRSRLSQRHFKLPNDKNGCQKYVRTLNKLMITRVLIALKIRKIETRWTEPWCRRKSYIERLKLKHCSMFALKSLLIKRYRIFSNFHKKNLHLSMQMKCRHIVSHGSPESVFNWSGDRRKVFQRTFLCDRPFIKFFHIST